MGFWAVPALWLTTSAIDQRMEFVMMVVGACAASCPDARAGAAIMPAVVVADYTAYGSTTLNRAYAFIREWGDLQTNRGQRQAADLAASSLQVLGAVDTVGGFA